ncbi:MAG: acyl-ACP--UDP-N-acetylglucosamine O-acyltransferase [Byssovorax sp.]
MSAVVIHPSALVAPSAVLGEGVVIGPFAVVEDEVAIGRETKIEAHAVIRSGTKMGEHNLVHPFAVLGGTPQDRRFAREPTELVIGDHNVFREHVTAHRGTAHGGGLTRVGSHGLFMAGVHLAHDTKVGDHVILANNTLLGGHVELGDHVVTGGQVALAPFVRVGERAFLAGGAMVEKSVPPFVIAAGDRARVRALNKVGLGRTGVPEPSQKALERAFKAIFRSEVPQALAALALVDDDDLFVRALARAVVAQPSR